MKSEYIYLILTWLYELLNLAFVANRLYVRAVAGRSLNFSDGLVVTAFLFVTAYACLGTVLVATGAGSTFVGVLGLDPFVPVQDRRWVEFWLKLNWAMDIGYYFPLYCIKGAILSFLLEVTPPALPKIRKAILVGVIFSILGFVYGPFPGVFTCKPLKAYWNVSVEYPADVCTQGDILSKMAVAWHMFTDVYIFIIPFFLIRHLPKMISFYHRLATYLMFGAGLLLLGTSFPQLDYGVDPSNIGTWNTWWGLHELNLAVTVACLPQLRVTSQRVLRRGSGCEGVEGNGSRRRKRSGLAGLTRGFLDTREVAHTSRTEMDVENSYQTTVESNRDVGVQEDREL